MTLRPAIHSTPEPPIEITDVLLKEYVQELRRRIEVQNDLMESLARDVQKLQTDETKLVDMIEQLTLDLSLYSR
jgi:Skp family chaperone for outer membrane proteins